jgi:hypothetical protein
MTQILAKIAVITDIYILVELAVMNKKKFFLDVANQNTNKIKTYGSVIAFSTSYCRMQYPTNRNSVLKNAAFSEKGRTKTLVKKVPSADIILKQSRRFMKLFGIE